jgi:hypothetical protein
MKFKLGFKTIIAGPGETVVVPAGKRHRFSNAGTRMPTCASRSGRRFGWRSYSRRPSRSPTRGG